MRFEWSSISCTYLTQVSRGTRWAQWNNNVHDPYLFLDHTNFSISNLVIFILVTTAPKVSNLSCLSSFVLFFNQALKLRLLTNDLLNHTKVRVLCYILSKCSYILGSIQDKENFLLKKKTDSHLLTTLVVTSFNDSIRVPFCWQKFKPEKSATYAETHNPVLFIYLLRL